MLAWNNRAGQFTVPRSAAPKVTAEGALTPASVRRGETVTLSARVTARGNALYNALVDLEVYSPAVTKICQPTIPGVTITASQTRTFSAACPILKSATPGTYVLRIGVFGASWSPLYTWNNGAATSSVTG